MSIIIGAATSRRFIKETHLSINSDASVVLGMCVIVSIDLPEERLGTLGRVAGYCRYPRVVH